MQMIWLNRLEKRYGDKTVLNIPGLSISPGIYHLKGINGSGKSTFLRILAGLTPFAGDVFCDNFSLKTDSLEYRRLVSFAEAEPAYPPFLTGMQLVSFYKKIRQADGHQVEMLSSFSGLGGELGKAVGNYSSGMIKRLSLLLAFVAHPRLILLDEPLATLDSTLLTELPLIIRLLNQEHGCSFIFSSHQAFPDNYNFITGELIVADNTIRQQP